MKFTATVRNITGNKFKDAFHKVITQCGLKNVFHKKINQLSKGYKQRVGLASAIIHNPKILILDEPVTGLDPNQIVEVRQLIKNLGKEKLVLMSSHILQEIEATVDRIIIIHNGEIVADGTSDELINDSKGLSELEIELLDADESKIKDMKAKVPSINVKSIMTTDSKSKKVTLEHNSNSDPRKDVFEYVVKNKWTLIQMNSSKRNLEDIFRKLTKQGVKADA